jgi:hypothetical protein
MLFLNMNTTIIVPCRLINKKKNSFIGRRKGWHRREPRERVNEKDKITRFHNLWKTHMKRQ